MSTRKRRSTDEQKTGIYDSNVGKRAKSATRKGHESGSDIPLPTNMPTLPDKGQTRVEIGTPTEIDRPRERSEPIQVISMKSPAEI